MDKTSQHSAIQLFKRATSLNRLVTKHTHPKILLALKRSSAALRASALMLPRLDGAAQAYTARKIRTAKGQKDQGLARADVYLSVGIAVFSYRNLLESAARLADGKDVEVLKLLGERTLELLLKVGIVVSGYKQVKDAAEIFDILREAVFTGQTIKHRRQQIPVASDLLYWIGAIELAALAWCFAAKLFCLGTVGKGQSSQRDILAHVVKSIDRAERFWKDPVL